jgi:hypothetical protein
MVTGPAMDGEGDFPKLQDPADCPIPLTTVFAPSVAGSPAHVGIIQAGNPHRRPTLDTFAVPLNFAVRNW